MGGRPSSVALSQEARNARPPGLRLLPPHRFNKIRVRGEIERNLDLKNLVHKSHIIGPHRVSVEHLRIVLNRNVKLVAKGLQVEGFEKVSVNDLLGGSVNDGEHVAYREMCRAW